MPDKNVRRNLAALPTIDKITGEINIIIETPKGSRIKYAYIPKKDLFELRDFMPEGSMFPYNFGFFPSTLAHDGDPLDVLVLVDTPIPPGTLLRGRLIGVIEAEETQKDGEVLRNDRLLAVADNAWEYGGDEHIDALPEKMIQELESFFAMYEEYNGKAFKSLGKRGPKRAAKLLKCAQKAYRKQDKEACRPPK